MANQKYDQSSINEGEMFEKDGIRYRVEETTSDHVMLKSLSDDSIQELAWDDLSTFSRSTSA